MTPDDIKPGTKLSSAVSDVEVVVVRPPGTPVEIACGGVAMTTESGGSSADVDGETLIGKRYVHEASGLELLCTRGGAGSVSIDGELMSRKEASPLPSSD